MSAPLGGGSVVEFTLVTDGVTEPVQVTHAPNDPRLFIVEQGGTIHIYKNGALLPTPFLDIANLTSDGSEQGLLSMAFDPDYASNGLFYVYYTDDIATPGDITLARYSVSANPDVADEASAEIVLVIPHPTNANHNGGQLMFGPDGYLYMGTGDGGGGGDVPNNAQNLNVLLGKMLRLDVSGTGAVPCGQTAAAPYGIPADEPVRRTGRLRRDLVVWPAQPLALQLRPRHGRHAHRRRRPEPLGGDRLSARRQQRRRRTGAGA